MVISLAFIFMCERIYAQPLLFCLKIAEKQYFLFWNFASFFQTATDSNIVTSQVSVRVFAQTDFDWVGSETNIPDDSFGGYEIAPSSQILYLDIQTLQPSWNIFNVRKYKRHNIISHNFIIKIPIMQPIFRIMRFVFVKELFIYTTPRYPLSIIVLEFCCPMNLRSPQWGLKVFRRLMRCWWARLVT